MGEENQKQSNTFQLTLDWRIVAGVLLAVIIAMLVIWRPWSADTDRTISVTGEATVSAEPDEYVFTPTYQFDDEDSDAALEALEAKSEEVVAELKALGVEDSRIKTSSNGYDMPVRSLPEIEGTTYNLTIMVTINDKDLAQSVQDYLLTTSPTGSVTPHVTFSDDKRRELENQARDQATQDARAKAEQSASNLGFSLGSVKSVSDGSGFGVYPLRGDGEASIAQDTARLSLQPGENDLNYSVDVVYYLR